MGVGAVGAGTDRVPDGSAEGASDEEGEKGCAERPDDAESVEEVDEAQVRDHVER